MTSTTTKQEEEEGEEKKLTEQIGCLSIESVEVTVEDEYFDPNETTIDFNCLFASEVFQDPLLKASYLGITRIPNMTRLPMREMQPNLTAALEREHIARVRSRSLKTEML